MAGTNWRNGTSGFGSSSSSGLNAQMSRGSFIRAAGVGAAGVAGAAAGFSKNASTAGVASGTVRIWPAGETSEDWYRPEFDYLHYYVECIEGNGTGQLCSQVAGYRGLPKLNPCTKDAAEIQAALARVDRADSSFVLRGRKWYYAMDPTRPVGPENPSLVPSLRGAGNPKNAANNYKNASEVILMNDKVPFDLGLTFINYSFDLDFLFDMWLHGEIGPKDLPQFPEGKPLTTIRNGGAAIGIGWADYSSVRNAKISHLISDGAKGIFCGAYRNCAVEHNSLKIVNFKPATNTAVPLYTHAIGSFTVKNCEVSVAGRAFTEGAICAPVIPPGGNAVTFENNTVNTEGPGFFVFNNGIKPILIAGNTVNSGTNAINLLPSYFKGSSSIGPAQILDNHITVADGVGISTLGAHDSVISGNQVRAPTGILLDYGMTSSDIINNRIDSNTVSAGKPYVVHEGVYGTNPDGSYQVDPATFPHMKNNSFLNPIGGKELYLENTDWNIFLNPSYGNFVDSMFTKQPPAYLPENPNSSGNYQGPKPNKMLSGWIMTKITLM